MTTSGKPIEYFEYNKGLWFRICNIFLMQKFCWDKYEYQYREEKYQNKFQIIKCFSKFKCYFWIFMYFKLNVIKLVLLLIFNSLKTENYYTQMPPFQNYIIIIIIYYYYTEHHKIKIKHKKWQNNKSKYVWWTLKRSSLLMVSSKPNSTNSWHDHLVSKDSLALKSMSEAIALKLKYAALKQKNLLPITQERLVKFNHSSLKDLITQIPKIQLKYGLEDCKIDLYAQQLRLNILNSNYSKVYLSEWLQLVL